MYTLGCDPELIPAINGSKISANEIFNSSTSMGCDGHSQTAELRPGYSTDPLELVCKIEKILDLTKQIPKLELYAGHFKYEESIGGHIHYGGTGINEDLLRKNNQTLFTLLNKIEPMGELSSRQQGGYGSATDMRRQSWGFEYRYPPSWLLSPSTAFAYLSVAKAVAVATENNEEIRLIGKNFYEKINNFIVDYNSFSTNLGFKELKKITKKNTSLDWNKNILLNW